MIAQIIQIQSKNKVKWIFHFSKILPIKTTLPTIEIL
jgi:hypothetical protein